MPDERKNFLTRVANELFPAVLPGVPIGCKENHCKATVSPGVCLGVDALKRFPRFVRVHLFADKIALPAEWSAFAAAGGASVVDGTVARVDLSPKGRVSLRYEWHQLSDDYSRDFPRALACANALGKLQRADSPIRRAVRRSGKDAVPPAIRRQDADELLSSAKSVIGLILGAERIMDRHKRAVINRMLWAITEEPWGKYTLPYRSRAALAETNPKNLRHEHVISRKSLLDDLLDRKISVDQVVDKAIACVVTKAEASLLDDRTGPAKGVEGWDRYTAARIEVVTVDREGQMRPFDHRPEVAPVLNS